jgi:hypothetical protein
MFWGKNRPTASCHEFGTHPASCAGTPCLKSGRHPVQVGGTPCLKNRRKPALYQGKTGRKPALYQGKNREQPASGRSASCRTFGCHKGFPFQTSCSWQNIVLPQKQETACLEIHDILFQIGCHKVCERRSLLFGYKTACHLFEQSPVSGRVTICLTVEGTACHTTCRTPCLSLPCLSTPPPYPLPAPLGQVVWNQDLLVQNTNVIR